MATWVDVPGALVAGRYELGEAVGRGGMAEVWRAHAVGAQGFRRAVAVKRVLKHLSNSKAYRAMFIEEARVTAQLDHPNIVQLFDFGEDPGGLFIVMEWIQGLSLGELSAVLEAWKARPAAPLVAAIGLCVLRALEAAHANTTTDTTGQLRASPILHRDVSPSNVLLCVNGTVKLADFGLARALDRSRLTPAGIVKGKLSYVAPELVLGKTATARSDIYSCAVMLWELLAGHRRFFHKSDLDIARALAAGERAPRVREFRPEAPVAIANAIDRAIDPNPDARFSSAEEFARALSDALRQVPERTDSAVLARELRQALALHRQSQAERTDNNSPNTGTALAANLTPRRRRAAKTIVREERSSLTHLPRVEIEEPQNAPKEG